MWKNRKKTVPDDEDDFLLITGNDTEYVPEKKIKIKLKKPEIKMSKTITGCIIGGVLIGLVAAFLVIDTGIIGTYKKNFAANISAINHSLGLSDIFNSSNVKKVDVEISETPVKIDIGSTFEQNSKMLPFENASLSQILLGNRGIVVAKSNYLSIFDSEGNVVWKTQTSVIEPILRVEGEYILLAEKGGTKICLYQDENMIYSVDDENEIITAQLSANGDVVLVTKKEFYKNAVSVYNRNGEQIFSWSSGTDTIINADISGSTRRIALSLINTDERVKSYVMLFDINKKEAYHNVEFTESAVFKTRFIGEVLNLVADNRLTGIEINGDVAWDNVYNDSELMLYAIDIEGNKAAVVDKNNLPELFVYSKKGDLKETVKLDILPDYIDIRFGDILFNNERIVEFGKPGKLNRYIASMDIKGLKIIDKNSFLIVYNNSLEFVKAK